MADEMDLREEDRLPWLETVEPDEPEGVGIGKVVALVVLGLGVLAAIVFGIYRLQTRGGEAGDGAVIAAQEGDYKVRPNDPGGLKVKGEGNSAIATSAGKGGTGTLFVNDQKVGEGRIERTQPMIFSADETADVGIDLGTPVVEAIGAEGRSRFTGRIPSVTVSVK